MDGDLLTSVDVAAMTTTRRYCWYQRLIINTVIDLVASVTGHVSLDAVIDCNSATVTRKTASMQASTGSARCKVVLMVRERCKLCFTLQLVQLKD